MTRLNFCETLRIYERKLLFYPLSRYSRKNYKSVERSSSDKWSVEVCASTDINDAKNNDHKIDSFETLTDKQPLKNGKRKKINKNKYD